MPNIKPVGDCALTVEFENEISIPINQKVHALDARLTALALPGVVETVPTYRTLIIHYKPEVILYGELARRVEALCQAPFSAQADEGLVVELPVLYGGEAPLNSETAHYDGWDGRETAPDMEDVMAFEGLSRQEVIRRHTAYPSYVYFQAFALGHSQLGCPQKTFTISRRATPRTLVPQGSVAIWAGQTVLNGFDLPCGWQVIGRTPVLLYDTRKEEPAYCRPGQWVRFVSITPAEYIALRDEALAGRYQPVTYPKSREGGDDLGN